MNACMHGSIHYTHVCCGELLAVEELVLWAVQVGTVPAESSRGSGELFVDCGE